jgi:hypothetical protein
VIDATYVGTGELPEELQVQIELAEGEIREQRSQCWAQTSRHEQLWGDL